jgi:hypothetical protein
MLSRSQICIPIGYEHIEADSCRLGVVLFQEVSVAALVATRVRQQRPRAQQREFM